MGAYIIKRLLLMVPTFLGVTLVTFVFIQMAPGNPAMIKLQSKGMMLSGDQAINKELIEQTKKLYGLDKPLPVQYLSWMKRVVTFDFGESFIDHRPVKVKIKEVLPISLTFGIVSILITYTISIPLGIYSAVKNGSVFDRVSTFFVFLFYSIPSYWLGIMLIVFFGGGGFWDIFPIYGVHSIGYEELPFFQRLGDSFMHYVLPLTCYTIGGFAMLSRLQRSSVLEIIQNDYIRTARAKGLNEKRVVLRHAFRNSLIPMITVFAFILPELLGGSIIIESIFSIPGLGKLTYDALIRRDYPVIMADTTIVALLVMAGILLSDILYVFVDPRISFETVES